jgi:hypothetical protein
VRRFLRLLVVVASFVIELLEVFAPAAAAV